MPQSSSVGKRFTTSLQLLLAAYQRAKPSWTQQVAQGLWLGDTGNRWGNLLTLSSRRGPRSAEQCAPESAPDVA